MPAWISGGLCSGTTTGRPHHRASLITFGNVSYSDVDTTQSAAAYADVKSATRPRKKTRRVSPSSFARRSRSARVGPSPTMISLPGASTRGICSTACSKALFGSQLPQSRIAKSSSSSPRLARNAARASAVGSKGVQPSGISLRRGAARGSKRAISSACSRVETKIRVAPRSARRSMEITPSSLIRFQNPDRRP